MYNYQTCFPLETIKFKYKTRNPWITQELKNQNQITFIHNFKKNPITENIKFFKQYKKQKILQTERDYYREQFEIHQHDMKR